MAEDRKKQGNDFKGHKGHKNKSVKRSGKKGDSPMKDLDLTEAQSAKVKTINAQYRERMMELKKNKKAAAFYNTMPPSHKKEYLQWILEAKRDETRLKRVRQAIDMLSEGKGRNWKYETKK